MGMAIQVVNEKLDKEWIELILTAQKLGYSIEEIRHFLQSEHHNHNHNHSQNH